MKLRVVVEDPAAISTAGMIFMVGELFLPLGRAFDDVGDIAGRDQLEVLVSYTGIYYSQASPECSGYHSPLFLHCKLSELGKPSLDLYLNVYIRDMGGEYVLTSLLATVSGRVTSRSSRNIMELVGPVILDSYTEHFEEISTQASEPQTGSETRGVDQ